MSGPNILFDKSFLQSLSLDESVLFDHFFHPVISPLFFVETLADLEKAVRQGRTPEQEVGIIADKVPEMNGFPNVHHTKLGIANLMGQDLIMDGRVVVAGGRPVKVEGKRGVVYEQSPESEAFSRWQQRQFLHIERHIARSWREALNATDLATLAAGMRAMGIDAQTCRAPSEAKDLTRAFLNRIDNVPDKIRLARIVLGAIPVCETIALSAWEAGGRLSLADYAPYTAHILNVELFFQIALAANLIGTGRPSNRVDIAYLFYLPFCHCFVSSDNLHRRCSPHFLRADQSFVWGPDLKEGLKQLVACYTAMPDKNKEQGLYQFAPAPPRDDPKCLISQLWDRHMSPSWRNLHELKLSREEMQDPELLEHLNQFTSAPRLSPDQIDFNPVDAEVVTLQRRVRRRKGSFWQVPKDLNQD